MKISERFTGRPSDSRIETESRCYDLLDGLGVPYDRVDHDFAETIEMCRGVEQVLGCGICKNLLLTNRQMTDVYLLLMPGGKPFKTKLLSSQIGSARLSFATQEQMLRHLGVTPGSVSVLGLMNDSDNSVRLLIDRELLSEEYFGCHPCLNSSSLRIKTDAVINKVIPAMRHEITYVEL